MANGESAWTWLWRLLHGGVVVAAAGMLIVIGSDRQRFSQAAETVEQLVPQVNANTTMNSSQAVQIEQVRERLDREESSRTKQMEAIRSDLQYIRERIDQFTSNRSNRSH